MNKVSLYVTSIICMMMLLASCNINLCKKPQLEVYYVNPYTDFSTAITPKELKEFLNYDSIAYKEIPKEEWNYINSNIKKTNIRKKSISMPLVIVKSDSLIFYIDRINNNPSAYDENYDSISITQKAIYLLLKDADYYNKMTLDDLKDEDFIKKFGIPKDYKFRYDDTDDYDDGVIRKPINRKITYHLQPDD